jgi:hypothetical protein
LLQLGQPSPIQSARYHIAVSLTARSIAQLFIDDFSQPPEVFYRELPPYGIRFSFAKLATSGVEVNGYIGWTGSSISTFGGCTDAIPPSCFSGLGFEFDATELGALPQAVGFAVSGFGSFVLLAYDSQNQLVESISAEFNFLDDLPILSGEFTLSPPPPNVFIGATHVEGIARIDLHSNQALFELDDFQYGRLVPEPVSTSLLIAGVLIVIGMNRQGRSRPFLAQR